MNGIGLCLVLGLAQTAAAPSGSDRLSALARDGPEAVLLQQVRTQPDDVREALRQLLTASQFAAAERLASAYAVAWRDSFLIKQVARYRSWSPDQRRAKAVVDSLRRAGNDALGQIGIDTAVALWRESVRRASALGDTAARAAGLGNIGRGFYEQDELDSAGAYFAQSGELAKRVRDLRTLGNAVGNLASISKDRGDLRQAESLYARAGQIRSRTGDARGLAADENNRGLIAQTLGDLDGARRAFETALAANRRADRHTPAAVNLTNLGNLASFTGDFAAAATRYRDALALYRHDGNRLGAAEVWHDLGLLKINSGDYTGATSALSAALQIFDSTGPATSVASVRRDLAEARAATGDLQGALSELRRAEATVGTGTENGDLRAGLALARADLAVLLNQPADAEREYSRAQVLYHQANDGVGEAEAFQGRGQLFLLRQDYPEARDALELALRAQGSAAPRTRALTQLLLGYALQESGDTAGARRALTPALDTLRAVGDAVGEAAALGALGDLAAREGTGFTAESLYRRGLERVAAVVAPSVSWPLHTGLGQVLRSRGALAEAAAELRAAIADVERVAGRLPLEQRRASYLADKWDAYAQLALVERARGRTEAAFEASERLRARQMLDLLARGRVAWGSSGSDSVAGREQELRLRISDLTRRLEDTEAGADRREPGAGAAVAVREALNVAQAAYADLLERMQESSPEYAHLVQGRVVPLREVSSRLAPDEALLEYLVTDSTTLVFVVTRDTGAALDLGIDRHALASLVDFTRGAVTRPVPATTGLSWRAPLERLYQFLVSPVEAAGLLRGKRALILVPHAELHYLPFAALLRAGSPEQFLVERYVLTSAPSASVWVRLRQRIDVTPGTSVLALAPRIDALPGTRAEVDAIGHAFGTRARILLGARASKRALWSTAAQQEIIHFATYGVLNKHNPLFSFIELARGESEDGRLEVHDVFGLDLHARLVVLSACQTALGSGELADVPAGDDWVGLVQAFLYAGASNVLATQWPVEDRATADLMARFYAALRAGRSEAEVLAEVQRSMLRDSVTADPFYWAGFVLSGSR